MEWVWVDAEGVEGAEEAEGGEGLDVVVICPTWVKVGLATMASAGCAVDCEDAPGITGVLDCVEGAVVPAGSSLQPVSMRTSKTRAS